MWYWKSAPPKVHTENQCHEGDTENKCPPDQCHWHWFPACLLPTPQALLLSSNRGHLDQVYLAWRTSLQEPPSTLVSCRSFLRLATNTYHTFCHDHAQPLPRPSHNSNPSPATPKLIAVPQLNSGHYVNLWPRTSPYHLPATCLVSRTKHVWYSEHGMYCRFEIILEWAMSATHVAVIPHMRTHSDKEEFPKKRLSWREWWPPDI